MNISIHFDTGMSRLGLDRTETEDLLKKRDTYQALKFENDYESSSMC